MNELRKQRVPQDEIRVATVPDGNAPGAHNRFIDGVADTQATAGHMTWTADEGVRSIRFKLIPGTGSPVSGEVVRVVFDASPVDDTTDDTQAWAWLADVSGSEDTDVEYFELTYIAPADLVGAEDGWSRWFDFGAPLRRADFSYVDGSVAASPDKNIKIFAEVG